MSSDPIDPAPPSDMADDGAGAGEAASEPSRDQDEPGGESEHRDVMGIDDDDPIDATLVGGPVEDEEGDEGD